jgi:hypothetical protein
MKPIECPREPEVLELAAAGRWPDRCGDDVHAHVTQCSICSDAVEVAIALREDYQEAVAHAHVPPAGLVWWRAELRARQEAMRTVSRPMTFVQAFGGACAAGVVVAVFSQFWPLIKNWFALPALPQVEMTALNPLLATWGAPIAFAIVLAVIVVAPVAMYLVLSDE